MARGEHGQRPDTDTAPARPSFFANVSAVAGARVLSIAAQVVVLPVIARYLTLADFGAVALAMSIIVFAQLLSDCGLGRSLVRQATFEPAEWDSVFWLLLALGIGLCVVVFVTAPLWAWLFDIPRLTGLVQALSVVPFLQSVSAVSNASLERSERFLWIGGVRAVSVALGLATAIGLAVAGAGAWSLILQQIVLFATIAVGSLIGSGYRPSLRFVREGLATHLLFARDTMGTSLVFMMQRQAPVLLLGVATTAGQLGLFSMALRLLRLPEMGLAGPAAQVVFVKMARRAADPEAIARLYVAALRLLALVIVPAFFCLAGAASAIIPLVLSDRWGDVAFVFALAAPGFAIEATTSAAGVVFQAAGATTLRLRMATERAILQVATVAAAVSFGIEAVALSLTLFALLYTPRYWSFTRRAAPFRLSDAARAIAWPIATGISAWLVTALLVLPATGHSTGLLLASVAGVTLAAYGLAALGQWRALRAAVALYRAD